MSRFKTMVITVALLSAPILAAGQSDEAETKRQVLATDEQRVEALRRNDPAPLRKIYADDYTLVTEEASSTRRPISSRLSRPACSDMTSLRSRSALCAYTATS